MDDSYPAWIDYYCPKLYSFVFALLPDELQSKQLVIDSFSKIIMENQDLISSIEEEESSSKKQLMLLLFSQAFKLAKKRAYQLEGLLVDNDLIDESNRTFYESLNFEQRAVLFLSMQMNFSIENIMEIIRKKRFEVVELLHLSRNKLVAPIEHQQRVV